MAVASMNCGGSVSIPFSCSTPAGISRAIPLRRADHPGLKGCPRRTREGLQGGPGREPPVPLCGCPGSAREASVCACLEWVPRGPGSGLGRGGRSRGGTAGHWRAALCVLSGRGLHCSRDCGRGLCRGASPATEQWGRSCRRGASGRARSERPSCDDRRGCEARQSGA